MNLTIRLFFIVAVLIMTGCVKNEFSVEFELPEDVDTNIRASYHATDKRGGMQIEAVAPIAKGKASLKCVTREPTLVYLYSGSSRQATVIYAERGDKVTISGTGKQPERWTIGGNSINGRWSEWRNHYADTLASGNLRHINAAVEEYVNANRTDPLSTLLLLTSFSREEDEELFRKLWFRLEGDASDSRWTDMTGRADQPSMALTMPGKLISMAMRSASMGVDTIRTRNAKATFLFFWNSGFSGRKETIDTIRSLSKEFPDSSSRIIADICMEPDSMAWRNPLRSDSLRNVCRLWAPAGMADSRIMGLEVRRSPFFMVVTPDGNQLYRGTDIGKAASEFRRLMGK